MTDFDRLARIASRLAWLLILLIPAECLVLRRRWLFPSQRHGSDIIYRAVSFARRSQPLKHNPSSNFARLHDFSRTIVRLLLAPHQPHPVLSNRRPAVAQTNPQRTVQLPPSLPPLDPIAHARPTRQTLEDRGPRPALEVPQQIQRVVIVVRARYTLVRRDCVNVVPCRHVRHGHLDADEELAVHDFVLDCL